eukprot:TRINITY_DN732_c0_g1_i1.p1 TRINITY_DN732_c0_g1~~TRINITY_DN732_c0_g1_i1.p1  ORF type:complete len:604 (+),score=143.34 TRINITY_DN732_c0_g1_i1:121-1932(+)
MLQHDSKLFASTSGLSVFLGRRLAMQQTIGRRVSTERSTLVVLLFLIASAATDETAYNYDVVVYGATPAGCSAAIIAANGTGLRVALLEPSSRIGGMMVPGGIGLRDTGDFDSIFNDTRSVARKWIDLNGVHYGVPYVLQPDVVIGNVSLWTLLQSIAGGTLDVFTSEPLVEGPGGVTKDGTTIKSIATTSGSSWVAAQFIDASYDGDIVVGANLSYTYGRESRAAYNETLAGVQPFNRFQNFLVPVDPYWPDGSVLPYIEDGELPPVGSADSKLMPFSYRACLVQNDPTNELRFPEPPNYNASDFTLLSRYIASFDRVKFPKGPAMGDLIGILTYGGPVRYPTNASRTMRYDLCEGGGGTNGQTSPVTTDQPDINDGYVTTNRAGKAAIAAAVTYYVQGMLYFLQNDPSVPAATHDSANSYGLCKDAAAYWGEEAWPTQLYNREGVRLIGDYVATQNNVVRGECQPDSVATSSWTIDIHPMRRVALPASKSPYGVATALNEGQVGFERFPGNGSVWELRYPIMLPKRLEATNLLVPVCASTTHVVYGSVRVEPTFIQLGQAAGAAAFLAIKHGVDVHDVPISELQALQRANGVSPHWPPGAC